MKSRLLALCLFGALFASTAAAQSPGETARQAAAYLEQAAVSLSEADSARDRIRALTTTIQAYEDGLSAMRDGLRQAAQEEKVLRQSLAGRDAELMQLLAVLQSIERSGGAAQALHPDGPLPAVRAGMLASEFVPALNARAQLLAVELEDVRAILAVQRSGEAQLIEGLNNVQAARLALSQAVADRTDLPAPAATDEAIMEALINSAETLGAFSDNFSAPLSETAQIDSTWSLPVRGRVLRRFNEADAAGIARPGWVVATNAQAIVTTPDIATVRFAGELPDIGSVVILESQPGEVLILAGIGTVFVRRGQVLSKGDPVGLMGGETAQEQEKLIETELRGSQSGRETLYIELRQGREAVDPANRFPGQTE